MSALTAPLAASVGSETDNLVHLVCECDENTALCGTTLLGVDWTDDEGRDCVVCVDLEQAPCRVCGL